MEVLRLLLQHGVEAFEDRHPAGKQVIVVRGGLDEAVDGEVHARGLVAGELTVVEVRLMDDLGDHLDAPVLDPEALDEGLERAVLAVMAEVGAEGIERDPLARGIGCVGEGELRLEIAETLDEPGGSDPVDVGPRTRHPGAPSWGKRRAMAPTSDRARTRPCGAQTLGRRLPQAASTLPGRRLQVIDGLNTVQLTLQAIELAAQLRDRAMVVRLVPIEVSEDLPAPLNHGLVLGRANFVEEGGDVFIGHGLDTIYPQQRRLAAEGLDLLDEPLEELRCLRSFGQDPARTPQAHGAHPLELPPNTDPMPGRRARQARQERQPAHLALSVTRATLPVKRYIRRPRCRYPRPRRPRLARASPSSCGISSISAPSVSAARSR